MPSRPSLTQVAEHAGVSVSTANDAFDSDRKKRLAPETVASVLASAEALGYRRQKYVLSGPVYGFMNPRPQQAPDQLLEMWCKDFYAQQLAAVRAGGWVIGFTNDPDSDSVEVDGQLLESDVYALYTMWRKRLVSGFILTDGRPLGRDRRHEWLVANNVPFVQHGRGPADAPYCWIDLDDGAAISGLTDLLIDAGHKRIAHLGLSDDDTGPPVHRREAWAETVTRRLDYDEASINRMSRHIEFLEDGRAFATQASLFVEDTKPTAVVCDSDVIALQLQRILYQRGQLESVDVTGMDNDAARQSAIRPFPSATVDWASFGDKTIAFLEHSVRNSRRRNRSTRPTPALHELHPWQLVGTKLVEGPRS